MKRLIRFHNIYKSDTHEFSDCSTKYTILPHLIKDEDAHFETLKEFAKKLNLEIATSDKSPEHNGKTISHSIALTSSVKGRGNDSNYTEYLGLYSIQDGEGLDSSEEINKKLTLDQARNIVEDQLFGVSAVGENVDRGITLIKSGWKYYHDLPMLGYDLKHFEELMGITDEGFDDDTYRCDNCGKFDSRDDGYENNFSYVSEGLLGKNCGCLDEFLNSDEGLESKINNSDDPLTLSSAEEWQKKEEIIFLERFIGGWTDPGRGGCYGGNTVRNGDPKLILKQLLKIYPKKKFVFSIDESGQFQTYFSLWYVPSKKNSKIDKLQKTLADLKTE